MRTILSALLVFGALTTMATADNHKSGEKAGHDCDLAFEMKDIDGNTVDLEDYEGKVVLVVNVASRCGLTRHYSGLQSLYEKYGDKGFVVLGFPCNQFAGQEPGDEDAIKTFCTQKYNVTFPMFSKIEVNGEGAAELYKNLKAKTGGEEISWNFEKFLIGRDGKIIERFAPPTEPQDKKIVSAIEAELEKDA